MLNNNTKRNIPSLKGYYSATMGGEVISNRTGKTLTPFISHRGYEIVITSIHGVAKKYSVHRLIAETFCVTTKDKPIVNHIDGNKLNNCASNLEWCTYKENTQHAMNNGLDNHKVRNIGIKRLDAKSKYRNVTFRDGVSKGWCGSIKYNGKRVYAKWFKTEKEAAVHVNWIYDTLCIPNRPRNSIV